MANNIKEDDGNGRPGVSVSVYLTLGRRERLDVIAAALGENRSRVVERLVDGATDKWLENVIARRKGAS